MTLSYPRNLHNISAGVLMLLPQSRNECTTVPDTRSIAEQRPDRSSFFQLAVSPDDFHLHILF